MKYFYFTLFTILFFGCKNSPIKKDTVITPQINSSDWKSISLQKNINTNAIFNENQIRITSPEGMSGVYYKYPITRHFEVECGFEQDDNTILALFHDDGAGKPDINNFSAIGVENIDDTIYVYAIDCQNGIDNVFDNTSKVDKENYRHKLSGKEYSIPFDKTSKKFRLSYDELSSFTHFFYSVQKEFEGEIKDSWMELFPSPPWNTDNQKFYVGLLSKNGTATFKDVKMERTALEDESDIKTGFAVTKRNFVWSGNRGDAYVVTFGDEFAHCSKDYKFVFWEKMNDIPAWYLDNQLLFSYEFCETWEGGYPGCYEPMSDRFLAFSKVKILEDNDVRKVISWNYQLRNPDYHYPYDWMGGETPKAEELYYIYPDGYIVREIKFFQKLDTEFRNWNEVTEFILIAGTQTYPSDHVKYPALTISNMGSVSKQFLFDKKQHPQSFNSDDWDAYVISAHFLNHPDVFGSFIQEHQKGKELLFEVSWHTTNYKFAHWPVNRIHYKSDFSTQLPWKGVVSHTSLVGGGSRSNKEWSENYQTDDDGRKFRQWQALLGIVNNDVTADEMTNSWGNVATIDNVSSDDEFVTYQKAERTYIFKDNGDNQLSFELLPEKNLINPVIKIEDFKGQSDNINVFINGDKVHFKTVKLASSTLLIWCEASLLSLTQITINSK
ncbi:MAG: hypothetical protein O3C47_05920 [Bacteroidetes bacterium]|nr:hypothetical protein [Bacteroidota bacterium]